MSPGCFECRQYCSGGKTIFVSLAAAVFAAVWPEYQGLHGSFCLNLDNYRHAFRGGNFSTSSTKEPPSNSIHTFQVAISEWPSYDFFLFIYIKRLQRVVAMCVLICECKVVSVCVQCPCISMYVCIFTHAVSCKSTAK